MPLLNYVRTLGATAVSLLLAPPTAFAQADPAEAITKAGIVDIPLVLENIDAGAGARSLWAKGDKPANTVLARLSARPLQVAAMAAPGDLADGSQQQQLLWRAVPGGSNRSSEAGSLNLAEGWRTFCGTSEPRAFVCWIDTDGNGDFDHMAEAIAERGSKPYHITIIKAVRPLETPRPYHILPDAERPVIPIEIRNCDKDYDRPRFAAVSTVDRDMPVSLGEWHQKDSSFAVCRRGSQITPAAENAAQVPEGGYLARIGPLIFAVGPKKNATLSLVGPVNPQALYRLESASLVGLSVGMTPGQAQLIARQQFPYPVLMTGKGASIREGELGVGQTLATVPFRHAYRGKLTQDVTIATLLYKRSVSAGTIVYGFPARQSISYSVRVGYGPASPIPQAKEEGEFRDASMQLTWCAPLQGKVPEKEDPRSVGRSGWSAACIPHSLFGNHTIITDVLPAFAVTGISYDANSSSNDGPPPIERNDQMEFPAPLQLVYTYEGFEGDYISLNEKIFFGDTLTSTTPRKIHRQGRNAAVEIAGAGVKLSLTDEGMLSVKPLGAPVVGSSPLLAWDQTAMLREQLKKMGLKLVEPGSED